MNHQSFISLFLALCLWASCSQPTPEELAGRAAKEYYDYLLAGNYEAFLEGKAGADSLPFDYRQQLLLVCEQFMTQHSRDHQGISAVRFSNARMDTFTTETWVFLFLCYADSTQEEIVVPMIEYNGRWCMK